MKLNNDWSSVFSMNDKWEMVWLDNLCSIISEDKKRDLNILEIGSFHGQSTVLLSNWGPVISVDLFADLHDGLLNYEKIGQGHFVDFIKTVIRFKLWDRIVSTVATSDSLKIYPNLECDLIFIDASHKYEETKKDIINSTPHLANDGYLVIHDYKRDGYARPPYDKSHPHHTFDPNKDPWWGVAKAVDEFVEYGEFGIFEHYSGIVCLRRVEYIKEVKIWP